MRIPLLILIFGFTIFGANAQSFDVRQVKTNSIASFRAVSVADDSIAWIGGTNGTVGVTKNGGRSWSFQSIENFETADFRSLYAFDGRRALVVNAGSPMKVLLTEDGKQWHAVYENNHTEAFADGIDFWNENDGMIYGDPINGKMLLLRTTDGGRSWKEITSAPELESGEASFAASGTGIRCIGQHEIILCTGGKLSRIWISNDNGVHWSSRQTPILQGEQSTGTFSIAKNNQRLIIVGGDFKNDSLRADNNFYSDDMGKIWVHPKETTRGYRECVEAYKDGILFAVGPSGIDISSDHGETWKNFSNETKLHVIRRARRGSLLIAAGGGGKLLIIE